MLLGKLVRDVVVVAGGVILGEKLVESPKVRKLAREVRDEVRRGLRNTANEVADIARDCAEFFAEKPVTKDAPKA